MSSSRYSEEYLPGSALTQSMYLWLAGSRHIQPDSWWVQRGQPRTASGHGKLLRFEMLSCLTCISIVLFITNMDIHTILDNIALWNEVLQSKTTCFDGLKNATLAVRSCMGIDWQPWLPILQATCVIGFIEMILIILYRMPLERFVILLGLFF